MAHEIESTAWANEKPWHGLGTEVKPNLSAEQMLKAAKLDWTVSKQPLQTTGRFEVPGFFALQRNTDGAILDVVGSKYVPVQNDNAFAFFKDFVEAGKAKMETAGSLRGGRMIWGLANLGNEITLPGKDRVKGYLLIASPHEQGKSFKIALTAVRVVCHNTLTIGLAEAQATFRMTHRIQFDDSMQQVARKTLGLANDEFDRMASQAERLAKIKVKAQQQRDFLAKVFQPSLVDAPLDIFNEKAAKPLAYAMQALAHSPGHDLASAHNTAWGLVNAVTYVTDHLLSRSADARLSKAWFGRTANLKAKAFDLAGRL